MSVVPPLRPPDSPWQRLLRLQHRLWVHYLRLDSHVVPFNHREPWLPVRAWRTLRHCLAGRGWPLTANERRLLALRDRHAGQRCFILGNGPSLNHCDLTLLKDEITLGVNAIFLNREVMGFDPTYYLVEDVFVAEDRAAEINACHGPIKLFGNYLRYCFPEAEDTLWLNVRFRYDNYPGFPHFSENAARQVWTGGTVSYLCLQLAYFLGCSPVYLVGFDHDYVIPESVMREGGALTSREDDPNHFHPDYFGKGYRWHDPRVERMEQAYRRAGERFLAAGRPIYNATVGGRLEVFPRVDYASLLAGERA